MKRQLLIASLMVISIISSCAPDGVYVCMGGFARRYHKTESCEGLRNCGGIIKKMTKEEAQSMFKTPCHVCYSPKERGEQ